MAYQIPDRRVTPKGYYLDTLYQERRGKAPQSEYKWCIACGKTRIDSPGGYNTCQAYYTRGPSEDQPQEGDNS